MNRSTGSLYSHSQPTSFSSCRLGGLPENRPGSAWAGPSGPSSLGFTAFREPDPVAFPTDALPDVLRRWVEEVSAVLQVPQDLPAMLAIGLVGAASAKLMEVRLEPDWDEPINLYIAIGMPPGARKSPAFKLAMAPLRQWERDEADQMIPAVARYKSRKSSLENRQKNYQRAQTKGEASLKGWLAKLPGTIGRVAAILHIAEAAGAYSVGVEPRPREAPPRPLPELGPLPEPTATARPHRGNRLLVRESTPADDLFHLLQGAKGWSIPT